MNIKSQFHKAPKHQAIVARNSHVAHRNQHVTRTIWSNNLIPWITGKTMPAHIVSAPKRVKRIAKHRFVSRWAAKRSTPSMESVAQSVILVIVNSANQTVTYTAAMASNTIRSETVRFVPVQKPHQQRKKPQFSLNQVWNSVDSIKAHYTLYIGAFKAR